MSQDVEIDIKSRETATQELLLKIMLSALLGISIIPTPLMRHRVQRYMRYLYEEWPRHTLTMVGGGKGHPGENAGKLKALGTENMDSIEFIPSQFLQVSKTKSHSIDPQGADCIN